MRTELLQTKLYVPPIRSDLVPRPRLIEKLNAGLDGKLTLVSAPAGFGKTTLVSAWVGQTEMPVAWVSLDEQDNDLTRFLTYFIASLQRVQTGYGELALGGGPYGIVDSVYLKLVDYFELGDPTTPFRKGHSISYMDDRLLEKLGTDIRYVYPNLLPNSPVSPGGDPDTFKDSYGQVWHRAEPYFYTGAGILSHIQPGDDINQVMTFPNPEDPNWMEGVTERSRKLRGTTDYFVTMRMIASHGPFQTACDLRGTENFLKDLALHPEFAQELLARISDLLVGLFHQAMRAGGDYFDMIELPGDDYAYNVGTIISPRMFRKFIKPILSRFIETIRTYQPDIKIMFHSDGLITSLLEDLIDIGIDVVHPLEPLPGTDFIEINKQFGGRIAFLGAIDISHALPGDKEDVSAEVQTRIRQLAPGGGYILAPSNHIQADVPPENVEYLYKVARQFGVYPIR